MKIKILSCLLIILGLPVLNTVMCQTVYFNQTIDLAGEWGSGMSVLADDSVFHIAAITDLPKKVTIVELSQSGEVDTIKKYGNPQENWYPGNPGSLSHFPSGGYTLGGTIETSDPNYGLLLRFNSEFDTIYSRRIINSNYSVILTCSKPTFDGGIILTGEDYSSGSNTDIILLKTDSIGNEMWRKTKNIGIDDRGWSIIQSPDSGFVVGGYTYNPGAYHTGDPLIVKFDKNGTFLWSRNPGGPYQDGKAMVCLNDDNTFTVLTTIADSIFINDFDYARICVIKYSQDGVELWKKKYGESIGGNFVWNIKSLPDGGYICCGQQRIPGNYDIWRSGWLLRLNTDGDSLWFRRYTYTEVHPYYYNGLRDVAVCQDGGFITTGEVWDSYPNGLQKIWVLKVDSLGCEFEGCDSTVSVEEHEGGEAGEQGGMEAGRHGDLVIWPNPARDIVDCRWSNFDGRGKVMLMIYDIFGRTILSLPRLGEGQGGGWRSWQVDVSSLPAGIYLAVVRDEKSFLSSAKFIVAR